MDQGKNFHPEVYNENYNLIRHCIPTHKYRPQSSILFWVYRHLVIQKLLSLRLISNSAHE